MNDKKERENGEGEGSREMKAERGDGRCQQSKVDRGKVECNCDPMANSGNSITIIILTLFPRLTLTINRYQGNNDHKMEYVQKASDVVRDFRVGVSELKGVVTFH